MHTRVSFTIKVNTQNSDLNRFSRIFYFFFLSGNLQISLCGFPASAAGFVMFCAPSFETGFTFSAMMRC